MASTQSLPDSISGACWPLYVAAYCTIGLLFVVGCGYVTGHGAGTNAEETSDKLAPTEGAAVAPGYVATARHQTNEKLTESSHLQYFGFTLIDVYWDDPHDDTAKTNYLDEVAAFCNIADMLVVQPSQDITHQLQTMANHQVGAILHLNELFFHAVGTQAPSGTNYNLRDDYRQRWDEFCATNEMSKNHKTVRAFYIGEEPTWNGIGDAELQQACDYVKQTVPTVNIMIVEAFPALSDLVIPKSADWIGFDHYFIADVEASKPFHSELELLKSKRSASHQRIVLIPDAHFIPKVHRHLGVQRNDLSKVAEAYYRLAVRDESVVALLCYFWPGGFDDPTALGTRQMTDVREAYERIGRSIVGTR